MSHLDETAPSFIPHDVRVAFQRPLPILCSPSWRARLPAPPLVGSEPSALHALRALHPAPLLSPRDYRGHFSALLLAEEWQREADAPRSDLFTRLAVEHRPAPPPLPPAGSSLRPVWRSAICTKRRCQPRQPGASSG